MNKVEKVAAHGETQLKQLEEGYQVLLSTKAKQQDQELRSLETTHRTRLDQIKARHEAELKLEQDRHKAQLDIYKKNSKEAVERAETERLEGERKLAEERKKAKGA